MQDVVPKGAMLRGAIGSMLGGVMGQIRAEQIGAKSSALSHSGITSPSTQAHTQPAVAGMAEVMNTTEIMAKLFTWSLAPKHKPLGA